MMKLKNSREPSTMMKFVLEKSTRFVYHAFVWHFDNNDLFSWAAPVELVRSIDGNRRKLGNE